MRTIKSTSDFDKDYKMLSKKHYDFSKLEEVYNLLVEERELPNKYKDHYLSGNWQGFKECHIEKNILLIYKIIDNSVVLFRLGSHSDLLGK